jgi:hypothetical protein
VLLGVPAVVVAWMLLRRQASAVFIFAAALIVVGLGYLTATGQYSAGRHSAARTLG